MFVVVLGTFASASTWAFNVVRGLVASCDPDAISFFAERGEEVLANLPPTHGTVVLKAHMLDRPMVRLLNATGARVIFTDRDPLDSAASHRERFGQPVAQTALGICRTYVSAAMLRHPAKILSLCYEDRFTDDPLTLRRIADFLEIDLSETVATRIFEAHRSEVLRSRIADWAEERSFSGDPRSAAETLDLATQWHPGHLGDGEAGKGARLLSVEERDLVASICTRWSAVERWSNYSLIWPAQIFSYPEPRDVSAVPRLDVKAPEQVVFWGPYGALPPGVWRARPLVECDARAPVFFRLDAFVTATGRSDMIAMKLCSVPSARPDGISIEFNHLDHGDNVEVRMFSVAESGGKLSFRGVELTYLAPLDHPSPVRWRPADEGLGGQASATPCTTPRR